MEGIGEALAQFWRNYGGHVLAALGILAVGWLLLRFLVGPLRRWLGRTRIDPLVVSFLVNSVRAIVLFAIILGVLNQLGVETTSLLTLLGAVFLAISLSLQNALANFASGLVILSFRTVRVGDLIETGDVRGQVVELLPFHAVLVTADNQRVTVPNTVLTSASVRNHSALPTRRADWTLPLKPGDDLAAVKEALRGRLLADPRVRPDPPPLLYVKEWADDKRVLAVGAWTATADYQAVQQELLEALGRRLEELRPGAAAAPPPPAGPEPNPTR